MVVVIEVGKEWNPNNWDWRSYIGGYFESVIHAEKYLIEQGYDKDYDDIFFKERDSGALDIARITQFKKIDVSV